MKSWNPLVPRANSAFTEVAGLSRMELLAYWWRYLVACSSWWGLLCSLISPTVLPWWRGWSPITGIGGGWAPSCTRTGGTNSTAGGVWHTQVGVADWALPSCLVGDREERRSHHSTPPDVLAGSSVTSSFITSFTGVSEIQMVKNHKVWHLYEQIRQLKISLFYYR